MKPDTSKKENEVRRKKEFFLTGFESDELFEDFDCLNRMGNEEMHQGKTSLHDPTKAKKRFKNCKLTHFISIGSYRKKLWSYC